MELPRRRRVAAAGQDALRRLLSRARNPRPLSPGVALMQFSAAGILALLLLAVVGLNAVQGVAEQQAVEQTAEFAAAAANQVVKPAVTAGVLRGDPAALRRLDREVREYLLSDAVLRVKLWKAPGQIVYSDEPAYIGKAFPLSADERSTLVTGRSSGELSDLSGPDETLDRWPGVRQVVQVCAAVEGPDGKPMLLQLLVRDDDLGGVARDAARAELPAILLALIALLALQLPLALRLVRRVQQGQREREALHRHALEARDHERRRIARDLHDGVVQSLAGVSYSLSSVGTGQPDVPDDVLGVVRSAAVTTRDSAMELRTLVAELTPPTVYEVGLPRALEELVESVEATGVVRAELQVQPGFSAQPDVAALLFRAAQEALRNVIKHAQATHVLVRLECDARVVRVVVRDDGRGLSDSSTANGSGHHFGLRLLGETAREVGGTMNVTSGPAGGTTFLFELANR
ncbi:MAG TPA: ATP-binding protein [Actinomycetales bacterium]|nr:ATP-binding protein [Actinomycetales bacterium]